MSLIGPITLVLDGVTTTFTSLAPVIIDDSEHKVVLARLHPALRLIPLWRGPEYDEIGDWTQAQAEAKILELLGTNQQETLQSFVIA